MAAQQLALEPMGAARTPYVYICAGLAEHTCMHAVCSSPCKRTQMLPQAHDRGLQKGFAPAWAATSRPQKAVKCTQAADRFHSNRPLWPMVLEDAFLV